MPKLKPLTEEGWERVLLNTESCIRIEELFDDDDHDCVMRWLTIPLDRYDGKTSWDMMTTMTGAKAISDHLDEIDGLLFSEKLNK